MRSILRVALVCALVVLSGCQFGGAGDVTTTREPFDVPESTTTTPTTTPPPRIDVPGLTDEGVTDPNALASAHQISLRGQSYTLLRNVTHRFPNGTLRTRRTLRAEFGTDRESYRYRTEVEGTVPAMLRSPRGWGERWSNGSATYAAVTEANSTTYYSELSGEDFSGQYERFLVLFNAIETKLSGRSTQNGTTVYRVESTGAPHPEDLPVRADFSRAGRPDSVTNVSLVAWIDKRGTVRRYRLTYVATLDGTPIHVTETHRVTGIGTTTVKRPGWLPEAINQTDAALPSG